MLLASLWENVSRAFLSRIMIHLSSLIWLALYFVTKWNERRYSFRITSNRNVLTWFVLAILFSLIFGQVSAILQQAQKNTAKYHSIIDNMKQFSKLYKLPANLATRTIDFFMSTWAMNKGIDTDEVHIVFWNLYRSPLTDLTFNLEGFVLISKG